MIYDVIIIGGGITGCMTAYKLAKYDLKVALLEASCDVAMGTTKANSAIVHAGFDAECGTLKAHLNVKGAAQMEEICKTLDVPYNRCGSLVVAFGDKQEETLKTLLERGKKNGVPELSIIGRDELHRLEPNVSDEATAALLAPTAGIVCPYELSIACAEVANINETDFYFNFKVTEIKYRSGILTVGNGKRSMMTKFVVNCAGLHADEVAMTAGDVLPCSLIPRRGEYLLLDKSSGGTVSHTLFMTPTENGKGILVSPTVSGNLLLGPNAQKVSSRDATETTREGQDEVIAGALKLVPSVNIRSVITSFAGIRATPDTGDFIIEKSEKVKGLIHAAGIESPGLAASPAVGDCIVEELVSQGLTLEPRERYTPLRPKVIRFSQLTDDERAELAENNPAYARIICRCEGITEGEIIDAVKRPLGARNLDMVKRRTRAGMGRCQGGFCSPKVLDIIVRELSIKPEKVTKTGGNSYIIE